MVACNCIHLMRCKSEIVANLKALSVARTHTKYLLLSTLCCSITWIGDLPVCLCQQAARILIVSTDGINASSVAGVMVIRQGLHRGPVGTLMHMAGRSSGPVHSVAFERLLLRMQPSSLLCMTHNICCLADGVPSGALPTGALACDETSHMCPSRCR